MSDEKNRYIKIDDKNIEKIASMLNGIGLYYVKAALQSVMPLYKDDICGFAFFDELSAKEKQNMICDEDGIDLFQYKCSNCGEFLSDCSVNYCPQCGRRLFDKSKVVL